MQKIKIVTAGMIVLLTGFTAAGADEVLAGWHDTVTPARKLSKSADVTASGFSGIMDLSSSGDWVNGTRGSGDGTFGSKKDGTPVMGGTMETGGFSTKNSDNKAYIDYTVKNSGSQAYRLTWLCFDALRSYNGASDSFGVSIIKGDLPLADHFAKGIFRNANENASNILPGTDYDDIDVSLAELNLTLNPGQSITFRLHIYDTDLSKLSVLYLDNVAILGVPAEQVIGSSAGEADILLCSVRR